MGDLPWNLRRSVTLLFTCKSHSRLVVEVAKVLGVGECHLNLGLKNRVASLSPGHGVLELDGRLISTLGVGVLQETSASIGQLLGTVVGQGRPGPLPRQVPVAKVAWLAQLVVEVGNLWGELTACLSIGSGKGDGAGDDGGELHGWLKRMVGDMVLIRSDGK